VRRACRVLSAVTRQWHVISECTRGVVQVDSVNFSEDLPGTGFLSPNDESAYS
jgi:hypothetical protein